MIDVSKEFVKKVAQNYRDTSPEAIAKKEEEEALKVAESDSKKKRANFKQNILRSLSTPKMGEYK